MMKALLALLCSLLMWPQLAWGHAALVRAAPAPGAVLAQAPAVIELIFSEPVGVTAARLFGPDGRLLPLGTIHDRGQQISIPVPQDTAQGTYLLSWRVVSADGHPIGGTLDYAVGAGSASAVLAQSPSSRSLDLSIWLARWLGYLCLFSVVGVAVFRLLDEKAHHAWSRPLAVLGLAALPVSLGLQGLDLRDAPWAALVQSATWAQALNSTYAMTLGLLALGLLAALAAQTARPPALGRAAAPVSLLLAGVALATSGHAGTAPPQWLSRPAVALHVMMAIAWAGMLIPLSRALRRPADPAGGHPALARFSRWITPVVLLLVLSGVLLTVLQLERVTDLWRTDYGRVLSVKLCLVGLLFCLAAYNRWRLTEPALSGQGTARHHLRRVIGAEIALVVMILAVVSVWRFTPPPRSLTTAPAAAAEAVTLSNERMRAVLEPDAGAWTIRLTHPDGQPLIAQSVTVALADPDAGIEPVRRSAQARSGGVWHVVLPVLPPNGRAQIELTVLVDDFDQITLAAQR
ncbi:MAG: CopD family protein [Castellaniella sp.]|uniref:copper resistance CopC/CopD family protein n=1 Tax=Castellaniella sp. TaxID=1955812 RepID=UPI003C78EF97